MRKGEWRYWGGDAGSTRYSALDQIDANNARELQIAWRWQSLPGDGEPDSNFKATPLMVDGVLYTSAGVHQAAAIDPKTGTTLWVFTPDPPKITGRGGVPPSGRGVAYWSDGREKRVFLNTLDGRLISVDARTGKADPKFGVNGTVLLKEQLTDRPVPMVGSSSPPIVVGNVIVVQTVSEVAATNKEAVPGHIRGYDVRTGKLLWTFHTIPQRGEPGVETWEKDSWTYTGNTGVWTLDERRPGARLRLSADRNAVARFLRRASARQQPLRRQHRVPRREDRQARVALPDRPSRHLGLRPARPRRFSVDITVERHARSGRSRSSRSRRSSTCSIA